MKQTDKDKFPEAARLANSTSATPFDEKPTTRWKKDGPQGGPSESIVMGHLWAGI